MTINLMNTVIGIDGRPWPRAASSHARSTGTSSTGSASSPSNAARSAGSSRTSTGNPKSNSDSTCPPDSRSIHPPTTRFAGRILRHNPDGATDYFRGK